MLDFDAFVSVFYYRYLLICIAANLLGMSLDCCS